MFPSTGPVVGPKQGCNKKPAAIHKQALPIQQAGFSYSGTEPIGPHGKDRKVIVTGAWIDRTTVKGTTRIKGGGCDTGKAPLEDDLPAARVVRGEAAQPRSASTQSRRRPQSARARRADVS